MSKESVAFPTKPRCTPAFIYQLWYQKFSWAEIWDEHLHCWWHLFLNAIVPYEKWTSHMGHCDGAVMASLVTVTAVLTLKPSPQIPYYHFFSIGRKRVVTRGTKSCKAIKLNCPIPYYSCGHVTQNSKDILVRLWDVSDMGNLSKLPVDCRSFWKNENWKIRWRWGDESQLAAILAMSHNWQGPDDIFATVVSNFKVKKWFCHGKPIALPHVTGPFDKMLALRLQPRPHLTWCQIFWSVASNFCEFCSFLHEINRLSTDQQRLRVLVLIVLLMECAN